MKAMSFAHLFIFPPKVSDGEKIFFNLDALHFYQQNQIVTRHH
tara:strand:- start:1192 stop:1320 length:129 start_codon:yes stop_codon:yes gene_type:complete